MYQKNNIYYFFPTDRPYYFWLSPVKLLINLVSPNSINTLKGCQHSRGNLTVRHLFLQDMFHYIIVSIVLFYKNTERKVIKTNKKHTNEKQSINYHLLISTTLKFSGCSQFPAVLSSINVPFRTKNTFPASEHFPKTEWKSHSSFYQFGSV